MFWRYSESSHYSTSFLLSVSITYAFIQISLYRDLERQHRKSSGDISVRFSPAVYSPPPPAHERLAIYEHKNSVVSLFLILKKCFISDNCSRNLGLPSVLFIL